MEYLTPKIIFYFLEAIVLFSAFIVVWSRNIVRSAFSLLFTFAGVAGIYIFLGADFIAGVQLLVYVGGILVLILFGVMFTNRIFDVKISNPVGNRLIAIVLAGFIFFLLYFRVFKETKWIEKAQAITPSTKPLGNLLLTKFILPFEVVSILLLMALIGAVIIARKEIKK